MSEPLEEDWNQFMPLCQGPLGIRQPPYQYFLVLDKGSMTPLPQDKQEEEQASEEGEP